MSSVRGCLLSLRSWQRGCIDNGFCSLLRALLTDFTFQIQRSSFHNNTKERIKPLVSMKETPVLFRIFLPNVTSTTHCFMGHIPEISSNDVTKGSHRIGPNLTEGNSLAGHTIVLSVNILSVNSTGYQMELNSVQGEMYLLRIFQTWQNFFK